MGAITAMDKMLEKILSSELLNEETRQEIAETFKKVLEEAKAEQEKRIRAELAERYEQDKTRIAEAVDQYVEQRVGAEMGELKSSMESLEAQRLKYVSETEKVRAEAKKFVEHKLKVLEAYLKDRYTKEMAEFHEDEKTNRAAVLKTIAELNARAEKDRVAFRNKAAAVIENIVTVRVGERMQALAEDIRIAKENDFGRRIYEAFMTEARRSFFNASSEFKKVMTRMQAMEAEHKQVLAATQKELTEAKQRAEKAEKTAFKLHESSMRSQKMAKLLSALPVGSARSQMKSLLEASSVADMEKTFQKFRGHVLKETRTPVRTAPGTVGVRTGNQTIQTLSESVDEDLVGLKRRSGQFEEERLLNMRKAG